MSPRERRQQQCPHVHRRYEKNPLEYVPVAVLVFAMDNISFIRLYSTMRHSLQLLIKPSLSACAPTGSSMFYVCQSIHCWIPNDAFAILHHLSPGTHAQIQGLTCRTPTTDPNLSTMLVARRSALFRSPIVVEKKNVKLALPCRLTLSLVARPYWGNDLKEAGDEGMGAQIFTPLKTAQYL